MPDLLAHSSCWRFNASRTSRAMCGRGSSMGLDVFLDERDLLPSLGRAAASPVVAAEPCDRVDDVFELREAVADEVDADDGPGAPSSTPAVDVDPPVRGERLVEELLDLRHLVVRGH